MTCPKCGAQNRDGAKFCLQCGLRLDTSPQPAPQSPLPAAPSKPFQCSKCGTGFESPLKFCRACGAPMAAPAPAPVAAPAAKAPTPPPPAAPTATLAAKSPAAPPPAPFQCPKCAAGFDSPLKFCRACGAPMAASAPVAAPEVKGPTPPPPAAPTTTLAAKSPAAPPPALFQCPKCAAGFDSPLKFCRACGAPMAASAPVAAPVVKGPTPPPPAAPTTTLAAKSPAAPPPAPFQCPKCAAGFDSPLKFCRACGAPMAASAPAPVAAPVVKGPTPPAPAAPTATLASKSPAAPSARPMVGAVAPASPPPTAPHKSRSIGMVVAFVAVGILLGGGGYLLYTRYLNPAAGSTAQQSTPAATAPSGQQSTAQTMAPADNPAQETPVARPSAFPQGATPRTPERQAQPAEEASPAGVTTTPAQAPDAAPQPAQAPDATGGAATPSQPASSPAPASPEPEPPARPQPRERTEVFRPQGSAAPVPSAEPAKPVGYSGPSSGIITWSGQLVKDGLITIDGSQPSTGSMRGTLPGVPVMVSISPSDIGVAEGPSPQNGWKRVVLRSRNNRNSVVTIQWTVLK